MPFFNSKISAQNWDKRTFAVKKEKISNYPQEIIQENKDFCTTKKLN